jgi:hypothetical protein
MADDDCSSLPEWVENLEDVPEIEAFDPLAALPAIVPDDTPVLWHCDNVYCLDKSRGWWLSPYRVVLCRNCKPPAFPELVCRQGTAHDAPDVLFGRTTTLAGFGPGNGVSGITCKAAKKAKLPEKHKPKPTMFD